ncbi:helix-turn-helix transcriptional regulator [Bacillus sp. V2I10]|jgi:putative transcriptional regulator|uniref:helix-turn-helix transcriptional regulator n=1 Tax=Bacillus sp. V2I10 TaxID=3042276 RepID=UPI00277EFF10|nr:helix-turn-helix transcriptional regulator [Bacillus sp. V2I10]MDQ0861128.1 putative transcriptional regulator [Bacillus sp. V2I10]
MGLNKNGVLTNNILILRMQKGWTQEELAKKLGVSRQTIISIERNKYAPSLILAFELANLFDKNIYEIFQYENDKGDN